MAKLHRSSVKALPIFIGSALLAAQPFAAQAQTPNQDLFDQIEAYSAEGQVMMNQAGGASQFSDVSPSDWAFQALDDLVRRYDCLKGYPNGTFRGNRALSRYEFAAGLNACLQQIERLIAETTADFATREDLETMNRLMQEFEAELAMLGTRVDNLESRVSFLEDNQFSTTTKLAGEAIFALNAISPRRNQPDTNANRLLEGTDTRFRDEIVFQDRVRLNFDTSFTGRDRLRTRLQARNVADWGVRTLTNEPRYGFGGDNGNDIQLDVLAYRFPIGSKTTAQIFANAAGMDDFLPTLNPFDSSGNGSISRFGQRNPILRAGGQNQGIGFMHKLNDNFNVSLGYTAGQGENPTSGIFGGSYALGGQIQFENDKFGVGLQYINAYTTNGGTGVTRSGLGTGTGSLAGDLALNGNAIGGTDNVVSNNYGLEVLYTPSDRLFVGGWIGMSKGIVINSGTADVWNYALTVGLPDLGGEGNLLGFVFGQQPRLAGSSSSLAGAFRGTSAANNDRANRDIGYHLEAFYRLRVNENIHITPGLVYFTNPGHSSVNADMLMGTLRTTFTF
ncbi:iron uptake porin [Spirulina sp. CCNP1310]|uniref:iron uptake porin n=1 Tax=Spirulina sp. CCNP1310 TaxID=3110249 RepID=UPI002B212D65|nr:iron uptake porin [Spirulina sp. CCNP1310]MEA5420792.1 iron uptake porin [Spirulina sp. CCNP1310]